MNAMTKKDIRTLWPFFSATFLTPLAFLPLLYYWHEDTVLEWSLFFCGILSVAMGVMIFGDEFSNRTMGLLLVQPLSRSKIWRRKMLLLGVALGICYAAVALRILLHLGLLFSTPTLLVFGLVLVFTIGVFCTTPFWTLCIRNSLGAIAATISTPLMLIFLTDAFIHYFFQQWSWSEDSHTAAILQPESLLVGGILSLYFGSCYWLGRSMFLHFEVTDSTGREIALPESLQPVFAPLWRALTPGHGGPLRSLVTKELYLQRVSIGMAVLFSVVFFLGALAWSASKSEWATTSATVTMATSFAICFMLIPLISGGVSVAEERNWGMHGWHIILPPSRRKQWLVKVAVVMVTSVVLGMFLPMAEFCVCKALFRFPLNPFHSPDSPLNRESGLGLINVVVLYSLLSGVALLMSSLARNTLQAMITAIALLVGSFSALPLTTELGTRTGRLITGNIFPVMIGDDKITKTLISALASGLLLVLIYLGFINFRRGEISSLRRWAQPIFILTVFAAIGFVLGFLFY